MPSVTAILASHNRRESTLSALRSYFDQHTPYEAVLSAVLVDASSADRTAEAVRTSFPDCRVIEVDRDVYWAGAMEVAESYARLALPDYLLWLNDDVELYPTALDQLIQLSTQVPTAVVVGAVADDETGRVSYGGVRVSKWHPLRVSSVGRTEQAVEVDTFHGNVVLVSRRIYESVGLIDGEYGHGAADFDYGLRARAAGMRILVAPGVVGTCDVNSGAGTWLDPAVPLTRRWRLLLSPKGRPPATLRRYLRRHGGVLWPVYWGATYLKFAGTSLGDAIRQALTGRNLQPTNHTTRIARSNDAAGNVTANDTRRADDCSSANASATENDAAHSDEDVILDYDGVTGGRSRQRCVPAGNEVGGMEIRVDDDDVGTDQDARANANRSGC